VTSFVLEVTSCRACGARAACENGLCRHCREARLWSDVNRAFCALIHRDRSRVGPGLSQ
jgi:hypothetical protein